MPKSSVKRSNHVWPNSSFSEDSSDSLPSVSEKWKSPARSSDSPWKHRKSSMQHSNILPPLTDGGFFAVFNKSPPLQHGVQRKSAFNFNSLAIELESEYHELDLRDTGEHSTWNIVSRAIKCLDFLHRIAEKPGPLQNILVIIHKHVKEAIFAPGSDDSEQTEATTITYLELCNKLRADNQDLFEERSSLTKKLSHFSLSSVHKQNPKAAPAISLSMSKLDVEDVSQGSGSHPQRLTMVEGRTGSSEGGASSSLDNQFVLENLVKEKEKLEAELQARQLQMHTLEYELEAHCQKYDQLMKESTELKGAFLRLKDEHLNLQDESKQLENEKERLFDSIQTMVPKADLQKMKEDYEMELDKIRASQGSSAPQEIPHHLTPRPEWKRAGMAKQVLLDCGVQPQSDSSSAAVDKVIKGYLKILEKKFARDPSLELIRQDSAKLTHGFKLEINDKFIECLGDSPEVPIFLRYNGQVRNMRMRKRDAEKAIRDIWQSKIKSEERKQAKDRASLENYLHNYSMEKFLGKSQKAAEWCYNLIVCLQFNSHDTDCALFLKILLGDLAEDVYLDERKQIDSCIHLAHVVDHDDHDGVKTGMASKEKFLIAIQNFFHKSYDQMLQLKRALDLAYGEEKTFAYGNLFQDDSNFSQNEFAEEFRSQTIQEREQHMEELRGMVESISDASSRRMSIEEFSSRMRLLDPVKSEEDVEIYVRRGCNCPFPKSLPEEEDADFFLRNLLHGVCKPGKLKQVSVQDMTEELRSSGTLFAENNQHKQAGEH